MDDSEAALRVKVLLRDKIKFMSHELKRTKPQKYREKLLKYLQVKLEGICSKHGYIHTGSIELYKIAPGIVEVAHLNGGSLFNVCFYATVCNPSVNSIIKARVTNTNRFGILAETGVLEIIVAKNSVNIESEIDLESVVAGDEITVEIIGKKFELGDKKISIIGRALSTNAINIALDATNINTGLDGLENLEGEDDEVDSIVSSIEDGEAEAEAEVEETEGKKDDAFFEEELEEPEDDPDEIEDDDFDIFDDDGDDLDDLADDGSASDDSYKEDK